MGQLFDILILVVIGAVAVTLAIGVYSLFRGGDFSRSHSNKLMRLRVVLQAVAIVLLLIWLWWRSQGG